MGLVSISAPAQEHQQDTSYSLGKEQFIYSYDEMFNFDIRAYLQQMAPHLLPYAEVISHYAGQSSISPKVLIALMEQQTGIVSDFQAASMKRPYGTLSRKHGFVEQVADISNRLASAFYQGHSYAETGVNEPLTTDADVVKAFQNLYSATASGNQPAYSADSNAASAVSDDARQSIDSLKQTYQLLFDASQPPQPQDESAAPDGAMQSQAVGAIADIDNYFQLPFPVGERWTFGGAHSNTGRGTYPLSSLDLNRGGYWGQNLSNIYIAAAAPGRVVVHSSCSMEIVHEGGWSTTYYHLSGIQVRHNTTVGRNTRIANYASNLRQALCNGGQSSGPHVHFSMKRNGQYYHLNGVKLSGFQVKTGRTSYDGNCNYFWLQKNNQKYCAWTWINNPGVSDDNVNPQPNILPLQNGQARSGIYGSKESFSYYKINVPAGARTLTIQSYGGQGDMDMHVRHGASPTLSSYHCRPFKQNNNETCTFESPAAGDWYVMLHGFTVFNGLSLKATYSNGSDTTGGGYSKSDLSSSQGRWLWYWIDVPQGMRQFAVKIAGANGDADLYVKRSGYPGFNSYDCRPYKQASTETCTSTTNPAGRWHIGVHAFKAFSGLTMQVEWKP